MLAGGKTVRPSRPPVICEADFPPRMGRRIEMKEISRAPAGARVILVAVYRGLRSACAPANFRQPSGFPIAMETKPA
jgi:hypothetical protein